MGVSTITVIDSNGNEVQKSVFVDDQGNIVDESDIDYIEESYIDEFGTKVTKKIAKIKDESFNNMLREELEGQKRYSIINDNKDLKNEVEFDKFGNKEIE